jgi:hypothetical protein
MTQIRSAAQEAAEDIFFGQAVIIFARWFVIITGVVVVLWTSNDVAELTMAVLMIVPLIAINFFVHGRYLVERPINQFLLLALSVVDVLIITLIVLVWQEPNGFASPYFILYYPIVLAVAFVFSIRISVGYTVFCLLLYSVAVILHDVAFQDTTLLRDPHQIEWLFVRLITLGAVGGLGAFYWRIQRQRRRMASGKIEMTPSTS